MSYWKYKETNTDKSWDKGVIYKENEDGTVPFKDKYSRACSKETFRHCKDMFIEVTEEEYNEQNNIVINALIFN